MNRHNLALDYAWAAVKECRRALNSVEISNETKVERNETPEVEIIIHC